MSIKTPLESSTAHTETVFLPSSTTVAPIVRTLPVRSFSITTSASGGSNITVKITEPALKADNLVLETWASSTILAAQLHHLDIKFPSALNQASPSTNSDDPTILPVVELGAGTGLVGITAASVWQQPVILTDLPPIIPGLESNIALNTPLFRPKPPSSHDTDASASTTKSTAAAPSNPIPRDPISVEAGILDWTSPSILTVPGAPAAPPDSPFAPSSPTSPSPTTDASFPATAGAAHHHARTKAHVLLAADCLYSAEHPALLSRVVSVWLSRDAGARFVLGTALRVAYLEEIRELWAALEGVGLECVSEGRGTAEERDFDDERLVEWSVWRWRRGEEDRR